ncbi:MAG: phosphate ABC transporter substrate-binding protein PstS [Geminicoccaceae bacterium]
MFWRSFAALALVSAVSLPPMPATAQGAVSISGAGATFPAPLYQRWIDRYKDVAPDVAIQYDPVGSGEGVKRFVAGETDFGGSDRAMEDDEIAQVDGGVRLIPATAGMVVLAYNLPGVEGELKLSREALAGIMLGNIRSWNDEAITATNPDLDLPKRTIAKVIRSDGSGTTFAFANHLNAISETWAAEHGATQTLDLPGVTMTAPGNDGVAGRINISEYSLGYVEYGFAKRLGLPVAALENQEGAFVLPSAESGQAAMRGSLGDMPEDMRLFMPDPAGQGAYPIVTYSWLLLHETYDDEAVGQALTDFVAWGLTEGQTFATDEDLNYIPLADEVAKLALSKIDPTR